MNLRTRYALDTIINARGTFTPLGVSRSPPGVCAAVAEALGDYYSLEQMQAAASRVLSGHCGAEAGAVVHCAAGGITLAVAAALTGADPAGVARLPDTQGLASRVVLPASHAVNYGQPIEQAIRLAGAVPVRAGDEGGCDSADIAAALAEGGACCLLMVSSRLSKGRPVDLAAGVAVAHRHGVPAIIDGAAQDFRMRDLLATGADLVIVSAQKYLAAPTAGLVVGRRDLVAAVQAHEKGIGRAMKASKEAIAGVLAALAEREATDEAAWRAEQRRKVEDFVARANGIAGLRARAEPDPTGLPFARAHLALDPSSARLTASELVIALRAQPTPIWVMDHRAAAGEIVLELVQVRDEEAASILARLAALLA